MAKETIAKDNAVSDALRRLKDEEGELITKLKPIQEAIGALEKIMDKSVRKTRPASGSKDNGSDATSDESTSDSGSES